MSLFDDKYLFVEGCLISWNEFKINKVYKIVLCQIKLMKNDNETDRLYTIEKSRQTYSLKKNVILSKNIVRVKKLKKCFDIIQSNFTL